MPRPPIPPDKREQVLTDVRAGTKSQRQIARDNGVSTTAVRKIAASAGLNDWSRERTEKATRASLADQRAQRAVLSQRFLDEANWLLDQMHKPHLVYSFGGKENSYNDRELPQPPTTDLRNLMVSAATAYDKHLAQDRHDAGGDTGVVSGLLTVLFGDLQAKHGDGTSAAG